MMNSEWDKLNSIGCAMTAPDRELIELLPQALALRDLFELRTNFSVNTGRDIGAGGTRLESGLAISPTLAAMCLREPFRTTAFIRGLHQAISDALLPGRPVRVLYAGCGPYAALALPLMTVFSREQATFTLLDIHQECLDGAQALIASFGLADHVEEYLCVDAARYRIPADRKPDVIVSETMAVALRNEPQVSIARNLLSQAPEAKMVPQSVSVEVAMVNGAKEHVFMPADHVGEIPPPDRDRIYLGKIFELDGANISSWQGVEGDRLPAGRITIPAPLESRYKPYFLTRIDVYGGNVLQNYDCSLTPPKYLPGRPVFSGGETVQFQYLLGAHPGLFFKVAN